MALDSANYRGWRWLAILAYAMIVTFNTAVFAGPATELADRNGVALGAQ